jgi:hypothetical protein
MADQAAKSECDLYPVVDAKGYGHVWHEGKPALAHRAAWIKAKGAIPDGMVLTRTCGNRACVNVDHMQLTTKGSIMPHGGRGHASSCKHGHDSYKYGRYENGNCKECARLSNLKQYFKVRGITEKNGKLRWIAPSGVPQWLDDTSDNREICRLQNKLVMSGKLNYNGTIVEPAQ